MGKIPDRGPTASGETRELPRLKEWTKENLFEKDWKFADFCGELERTALQRPETTGCLLVARAFSWELDRELGSGKGPFDLAKELATERIPLQEPFACQLTLRQHTGDVVAVSIEQPPFWLLESERRGQPLNEWHLGELAHYIMPDTYGASRGTNEICALEIPWSDSEDEVVERFRLWLRQHRGTTAKTHSRRGRKYEVRPRFTNLAIYRLSVAGYNRTHVLKRLGIKTMSSQNFARAKRFIRDMIEWRFKEMLFKAKRLAEEAPGKGFGDWQRHFIKQ